MVASHKACKYVPGMNFDDIFQLEIFNLRSHSWSTLWFHISSITQLAKMDFDRNPCCWSISQLKCIYYCLKWIYLLQTLQYIPAMRTKIKISSKLIFASCVWYSDRAYYWVCVLIKDIGRRFPFELQCSLYQRQQSDVNQSVRGNYKTWTYLILYDNRGCTRWKGGVHVATACCLSNERLTKGYRAAPALLLDSAAW